WNAPIHFQRQFKSAWVKLENTTLGVDADKKCHLCKHLVDAVGHPPAQFCTEVVRRRTLPLYRHPALVPWGQQHAEYMEPTDGSITDGDDHLWSSDPKLLPGGGGWRELEFSTSSLLGKRAQSRQESDASSSSDDVEEIQRVFFPSFETHDSDDEEQEPSIDEYSDHLRKRADELEQAAAILCAQIPHTNNLWMASIVKRNVGQDVGQMVGDIRKFEGTARVRNTTWGKDKKGRRSMQNTMEYQIPIETD
ncbi:hypothetical protein DFH09DRAFT_1136732, partial [Mycena vulgaris]